MHSELWQKCPVCEGTGTVWTPFSTGGCLCNTCNGHGIISIVTGYPPQGTKQTYSTDSTDYIIQYASDI